MHYRGPRCPGRSPSLDSYQRRRGRDDSLPEGKKKKRMSLSEHLGRFPRKEPTFCRRGERALAVIIERVAGMTAISAGKRGRRKVSRCVAES